MIKTERYNNFSANIVDVIEKRSFLKARDALIMGIYKQNSSNSFSQSTDKYLQHILNSKQKEINDPLLNILLVRAIAKRSNEYDIKLMNKIFAETVQKNINYGDIKIGIGMTLTKNGKKYIRKVPISINNMQSLYNILTNQPTQNLKLNSRKISNIIELLGFFGNNRSVKEVLIQLIPEHKRVNFSSENNFVDLIKEIKEDNLQKVVINAIKKEPSIAQFIPDNIGNMNADSKNKLLNIEDKEVVKDKDAEEQYLEHNEDKVDISKNNNVFYFGR